MGAQPKNDILNEDAQNGRKAVSGLLARALSEELEPALQALAGDEEITPLRGPETGLVMLRGRIGGGGSGFNLGETTVSRASIRLSDGLVGHGHCLGTDRKKAQMIAIFDALYQRSSMAEKLEKTLLGKVRARIASEQKKQAEETAATRVDFFTMVRGDN